MSKIVLSSGPTGDVVSKGDLKKAARITSSRQDATLQELLDEAVEAAEEYLWGKLLTQTWIEYFDGFASPLKLQYPPLDTVSTVQYIDTDGDTQTLSTDVWEQADEQGIGIVRLEYDQTWPSTRAHEDVVWVTFSCGYGEAADVPAPIRRAIRLYAIHQYRHREGEPVPEAFYDFLRPYSYRRFVKDNGEAP